MPWNGAGLFSRVRSWVTDAANGLDIQPDLMDQDTNDIALGLNNCRTLDGQNSPSADLPMNGRKHTGVADGAARNHYASVGQLQDGAATYCTAGGTANALTLAFSPAITTLVNGQRLRFRASATCAAGSTTAAVNGIATKAIKRPDGNDPAAGDITNGREYVLIYNSGSDTLVLDGILTAAQVGAFALTGDTLAGPALDTLVTITPSGSTFTMNLAAGNDFTCGTLSAPSTFATPTGGPSSGKAQGFAILTKQPSGGGATFTFGSGWVPVGSAAPNTGANKYNLIVGKAYPGGIFTYSVVAGV
ncbi:hypothetical protein [Azospirillum palustre]